MGGRSGEACDGLLMARIELSLKAGLYRNYARSATPTTTADTTFTGDIAVESAKISEIRADRGKGSWQTGTNLYKDEYLSLSLSLLLPQQPRSGFSR